MILLALALACTDTPQDTQTEETDTDTGDSVVEATPVWVPLDQDPPEDFAELHLFEWDPASSSITYNDGEIGRASCRERV